MAGLFGLKNGSFFFTHLWSNGGEGEGGMIVVNLLYLGKCHALPPSSLQWYVMSPPPSCHLSPSLSLISSLSPLNGIMTYCQLGRLGLLVVLLLCVNWILSHLPSRSTFLFMGLCTHLCGRPLTPTTHPTAGEAPWLCLQPQSRSLHAASHLSCLGQAFFPSFYHLVVLLNWTWCLSDYACICL